MQVEAAIKGDDIKDLRRLLAKAMNADFPAELINKANQRRMSLDMIADAEAVIATENIKQIDELIYDSKFKLPGMLVIAYAIDMNHWFSDLIARRNAISSRKDLERMLEQRKGIDELGLARLSADLRKMIRELKYTSNQISSSCVQYTSDTRILFFHTPAYIG